MAVIRDPATKPNGAKPKRRGERRHGGDRRLPDELYGEVAAAPPVEYTVVETDTGRDWKFWPPIGALLVICLLAALAGATAWEAIRGRPTAT